MKSGFYREEDEDMAVEVLPFGEDLGGVVIYSSIFHT